MKSPNSMIVDGIGRGRCKFHVCKYEEDNLKRQSEASFARET